MANYTEIVQIIIPGLTIANDYVSKITLHNPTDLTATIDQSEIRFTAFANKQKIFITLTKDILLPAMIVEVVTENLSVDIMSPIRFLYLSKLLACPSGSCKEEQITTTPVVPLGNVTMEMVTVGNPGNAVDGNTGFLYGAVAYSYQIGKYEVTGSQYAAFLNAIAKTDSTYGLYNTSMSTDTKVAQINRSGSSGAYMYSVMNSTGQRPITYVSWFDCARFCNWMSNGQPSGDQTITTTENGAYNLNGASTGSAIIVNAINPNTNLAPTFRIPTENEWYKAAYYTPNAGGPGVGGYWTYATQSNATPGTTISINPNQVNYNLARDYLTDVGSFGGTKSFYGTFDQSGNVYEWNDLNGTVGQYRGWRGGVWNGYVEYLKSSYRFGSASPDVGTNNNVGFRIASPVV